MTLTYQLTKHCTQTRHSPFKPIWPFWVFYLELHGVLQHAYSIILVYNPEKPIITVTNWPHTVGYIRCTKTVVNRPIFKELSPFFVIFAASRQLHIFLTKLVMSKQLCIYYTLFGRYPVMLLANHLLMCIQTTAMCT